MRKEGGIRRKEKGVAPVVAEILLVGMTVVIAAVLYVMVANIGNDEITTTPVGSMNLGSDSDVNTTSEKIYFGSIRPVQKPTNCKLVLFDTANGKKIGTYVFKIDKTGNLRGGQSSITIDYVDNLDDGILSKGDYLLISGLEPNKTYKVILTWTNNGGTICSIIFTK